MRRFAARPSGVSLAWAGSYWAKLAAERRSAGIPAPTMVLTTVIARAAASSQLEG